MRISHEHHTVVTHTHTHTRTHTHMFETHIHAFEITNLGYSHMHRTVKMEKFTVAGNKMCIFEVLSGFLGIPVNKRFEVTLVHMLRNLLFPTNYREVRS